MSVCTVQPISAFLSTNLSSKIECYQSLGDRILRQLGWPLITVQVHRDQLYDNISLAVEMFTKFCGYTQEYLVFDSNLYEIGRGIRLDTLFTIAGNGFRQVEGFGPISGEQQIVNKPDSVYIVMEEIPSSTFVLSPTLSGEFTEDIPTMTIFNEQVYTDITTFAPQTLSSFKQSNVKQTTVQCEPVDSTSYSKMFDYDTLEYRKVISVTDFQEGSTTGINTLFSLEQTLAQQTYFSYALGNHGFDLISWYTMKEWIDTREKMLATKRSYQFDDRTQYLKLYPQPKRNSRFYGVVECYVERPIRDVIKEQWVYQYSLALTKIVVGRVRSNFGAVTLLGGGSLNYDMLQEGMQEKEKLEALLTDMASTGLGDSAPAMFIIG